MHKKCICYKKCTYKKHCCFFYFSFLISLYDFRKFNFICIEKCARKVFLFKNINGIKVVLWKIRKILTCIQILKNYFYCISYIFMHIIKEWFEIFIDFSMHLKWNNTKRKSSWSTIGPKYPIDKFQSLISGSFRQMRLFGWKQRNCLYNDY